MQYRWTREHAARWDAGKQRIVGDAPVGIFDSRYKQCAEGDSLPGEWWRVEDEAGDTLGYGWLDAVWGDAEVLLAVAPGARGRGVGRFVIEQLDREAERRGLNYIYNHVRPTHPDPEKLEGWLRELGFAAREDGRMTRRVRGGRAPAHSTPQAGSIAWLDLTVADAPGVRDFYRAVVGWEVDDCDMGEYADYAMRPAGGENAVAGVCHARGANADLPAQWMVYIVVDDIDAAMRTCEAKGGEVVLRPMKGRPMAIIRDPAGAVCALYPSSG